MEIVKGLTRIVAMALLAAVITGVAFFAGYTQHWIAGAGAASPDYQAGTGAYSLPQSEGDPAEFSLFWEAWGLIQQKFYGKIPDNKGMTYGAIRGAVATLGDENTAFLDPERAKIFAEDLSGSFEGIGASVQMDEEGHLVVTELFSGQPAADAGLKKGDVIIKVDSTPLEGLNVLEAIALIRGPANSKVVLTISREGISEPFEVTVTRKKIEIPVVSWKMLPEGIAYVQLTEFNAQASDALRDALLQAQDENPKGLILDLRNNPGGYLDVSIEVASEFLKEGNVVFEQSRDERRRGFQVVDGGVAQDIPLAVLVNGGSASASEIVAGAIQDRSRGVLVGEKTFGKGSVQESHTLSDGSQLRVTVAHWLTPDGKDISKQGLTPDIEVEMDEQDASQDEDPQLERAVKYLLSGER